MSREVKTHQIGGFTYTVTQLGAKVGKNVLAHIARLLAPAFESADPVSKFASLLTDDELNFLCDNFAKATQFSADDDPDKVFGLADKFDDHFSGQYGRMVKWLWACMETNYSTFLDDMGLTAEVRAQLLEQAKAEIVPTLTSPTGPSGAASLRDSAA